MTYIDSLLSNGTVTNDIPKVGGSTTGNSVPPGFTAQQWAQLLKMAKNNPSLDALIKKYTSGGSSSADASWRRVLPTDTSQLLKQLSYNAGEMGMPGGYVGAIQLPAYGETQAPVNNPDMSKYGQAPGLGEATFYQQSMNGGMAPIAAMSPLGVPAGWNPGGTNADLESQLKDYLKKLNGGGGNKGGNMASALKASFEQFMHNSLGGGGFQGVMGIPEVGKLGNPRSGKGKGGSGNGGVTNWPGTEHPGGNGTAKPPGRGVPISLPFGF